MNDHRHVPRGVYGITNDGGPARLWCVQCGEELEWEGGDTYTLMDPVKTEERNRSYAAALLRNPHRVHTIAGKIAIGTASEGDLSEASCLLHELSDEVERLRKALGEQTEMVRRWKNRYHNIRKRLAKLRVRILEVHPDFKYDWDAPAEVEQWIPAS